jgi:hypothetical protein
MLHGVKKLDFKFTLTMAAYDLIKLPGLMERRHEYINPARTGKAATLQNHPLQPIVRSIKN